MQYILILPFIKKNKMHQQQPLFKFIHPLFPSGFQKIQNYKISSFVHLFLLLPIIQYLRARHDTADRLFPTDILDSCFPRGSLPPTPTPPVGAEPRTHASIDNDDRVAWHSINRTKTNNVRHACELWAESFSPPPPRPRVVIRLRLWARAEGRAGFLFPLPSNVVSRCKRERISSRDGRIMEEKERGEGAISSVRLHSRIIASVHFRALSIPH